MSTGLYLVHPKQLRYFAASVTSHVICNWESFHSPLSGPIEKLEHETLEKPNLKKETNWGKEFPHFLQILHPETLRPRPTCLYVQWIEKTHLLD